MKELFISILALFGALIMSCLNYPLGIIYSFFYSFVLSFSKKHRKKYNPKWGYFFFIYFWVRFIDGFAAAIGHLIYEVGYALDLGWNVNGEIIEDMVTAKENTTFSEKNVSVSASIGKLEIAGDLNKFGRWFSKALNFAFRQKSHAKGAWLFLQEKIRLKKEMFNQ